MKLSKQGYAALRRLEGERLNAYQDGAGVWTIGVGHTGKVNGVAICRGMSITAATSQALLESDVAQFEKAVNHNLKVTVSQQQFDALVIFAFNIGAKSFENSTALARLNRGDVNGCREAMGWFTKITVGNQKITSQGLVNRRLAEQKIFAGGVYV